MITTREELISILLESPGGDVVVKHMEPFDRFDDLTWTEIARALIRVQTATMKASNDRWAEVVK